jgi:N-acetylneuraminate synthase
VRPAKGLHPRFYQQFMGKSVTKDVAKGTPLDWDLVGA